MIRVALFGVVLVIVVGASAIVADRLLHPAESANEIVTSRFPEGWEFAPVVEPEKPPSFAPALPRMSTDEFLAAVTAVGRPRPAPRPPPPRDAVFNDAQIASIKNRLELTEQQEPYWQAVEASMREVVWDRSHGSRPRLEPNSLERFKQAVAPFVATLSARQRSAVEALAAIVGVRLNRKTR